MKATVTFNRSARRLVIRSEAEKGDNADGKYSGDRIFFRVPSEVEGAHPDLVALVTILSLHPFVKDRLALNLAVSGEFQETCDKWLPYRCEFAPTPRGVTINPRERGQRPGLSFSGGIDSVAALAVMPATTQAVFLDRVVPKGKPARSAYNKDSALAACKMIADRGFDVHRVATNMEYIRTPVGFPVDWSCGAPAILLADHLDLSSVAWGVVAESGYQVGGLGYQDFPKRSIFRRWDRLLRAVGLELAAPVAGVSEVGTALIERSSPLAGVGQSCIRGPKNEPCRSCPKCFRKLLLDSVLDNRKMPAADFERLIRFFGWEGIVLAKPIKHENVFRWAAERLRLGGSSPAWDAFRARLSIGDLDPSWASNWYQPSATLIPTDYRDHAVGMLRKYLPDQSADQRANFEAWDLRPTLESPNFESSLEHLRATVSSAPPEPESRLRRLTRQTAAKP